MKSIRTFSLLVICTSLLSISAYASIPTTGKGMWIWEIWADEGGNLTAIVDRLKSSGVTWVAVKLGDSNSLWDSANNSTLYPWASKYGGFAAVIDTFHNNGINVYGWQYIYGTSKWGGGGTEAGVTNEILDIPGIDGFIIDAEVEFEASGMTAVAAQYLSAVRAAHPNSFIALTSFASVTNQPIPWTTFLARCNANMPQAYWALRPTDPVTEFSNMWSAFETADQNWINEGYLASIKPIVPIGCENPAGETSYQMHYGDIQKFASLCQDTGYVGMSLWEYSDMDSTNWSDYTASWQNLPPTVPHVTNRFPSVTDSVPAYDSINVYLNTAMDASTMDSAFSITPPVKGKLIMNPDFTAWTFAPDTLLSSSTQYTVSIDTSAESLFGIHLLQPYSFTFNTGPINREGPYIVAASPRNGGSSVSKCYVEFILNEPIHLGSIASQIAFTDSTGRSVAFSEDQYRVTLGGFTLIAIRTVFNLTPGVKYSVTMGTGLTDYYNIALEKPYTISFTCDTSQASGGTVIEGFESSIGNWQQPSKSSISYGIDTTGNSFGLAYKAYDGFQSGGLQYQFNSANAICAAQNSSGYNLGSAGSFGMWVFGDNSGNQLDYIFGLSSPKVVPVDTINWYGWKFVSMWRDSSDSSTSLFSGFAVRRLPGALLAGSTIYVDDITVNGRVSVPIPPPLPIAFKLYQNYPNPFNPTTTIQFNVPSSGFVSLKVYDVLGREVRTLVDKMEQPGNYTVTFNAGNLPSGVYFYMLEAGRFTAVKKMMVLK